MTAFEICRVSRAADAHVRDAISFLTQQIAYIRGDKAISYRARNTPT